MSDAFECDRCGGMGGGPPALKVATSGIQEPAGSVSVETKNRRDPIQTVSFPPNNCTCSINQGDLCEDCAEAFREFWGDRDE